MYVHLPDIILTGNHKSKGIRCKVSRASNDLIAELIAEVKLLVLLAKRECESARV